VSARLPLVDLGESHRRIQDEVEAAALRVLRSGVYVLGPEVAAFEAELAAYLGVAHVVACASGTDALLLALLALGLGPGDEVVVPAFDFQAAAEVVSLLSGVPRFADIDPATYTMDPRRFAEVIGPRTRAVIPTHLYGLPCDMKAIREIADDHGVVVVEDACQAIGSRYRGRRVGGLGDVGCLSFFPTKNLGACGDGGALTTDSAELGAALRRLRNHGARAKHVHDAIGANSRLDELQAAILRVKLSHVDGWIAKRRELEARYDAGLAGLGVTLPVRLPDRVGNAHLYTIRAERRDALRAALAAEGIDTAVHYPLATPEQPVYASLRAADACPEAVRAAREVLSLPLFPEMDDSDVDRVVDAIARFASNGDAQGKC
jgi:dTDP-4-amino-4,6-dideoxygalactose transaminase